MRKNRRLFVFLLALTMLFGALGPGALATETQTTESGAKITYLHPEAQTTLDGWAEGSEVLSELVRFVQESVDETGDHYIPPADRIAVFDMDGTLYGERFPTYFNDWLFIQYALYNEDRIAPEVLQDFARQWEDKVLRGAVMPNFDADERFYGPQLYEGLTIAEYKDVVRAFKKLPCWGFEGMTYGEAFFKPMISVVKYLYDNGYTLYVNSATYRDAVRTMMEGTLDQVLASALGLPAVRLIKCGGDDPIAAAREQWNDGSNTLAVRPGTVMVYQRNAVTNDILYHAGVNLLEIPSAELSRGRGGPHCMSMAFWRDAVK